MPSDAPAPELPDGYPGRWEADAPLADGGTVHLRPVLPDDDERITAFHARQSPDDVYYRYFTSMPRLTPRMLDRLTRVDYVDHMGFLALLGDEVVGMASYDVWPQRGVAEVAFMVDRDHQGRGLGTLLLEYLVVAAREAGVPSLVAMVLPDNRRMLRMFQRAGFEAHTTFEDGVIEVGLALEVSDEATAAIEERARASEVRSVARVLDPGSIAVIGAGREPGGLGHEIFVNLLRRGFEGAVYPVNPAGGHVASVRAWPTVGDIPDEVDLAVLAVPADAVPCIVAECARKRVRGLVVTSAGFAGSAPEGLDLSRRVVDQARRWGMRVVGPESLGVINTSPATSMVATFAPVDVPAGAVGLLTQSGTLGVAALELARRKGVGISTFLDVGDKVDVSGNDVLQYWEDDERTSVATLYLESFGNPRKFVRIARRMARTTPIVAVKGGDLRPTGRSEDDRWPPEVTYGALLAQAGVIRVDTLPELFDVARVLLHQPVPTGRRVAVVSNSRGATTLTIDAAVVAGLSVATPSAASRDAVGEVLPAGWSLGEGFALPFDAGPDQYRVAVAAAQADPGVDAVVVVYAPATGDRRAEVVRAVGEVADAGVPVVASFPGASLDEPLTTASGRIPAFELPGDAVRTLGRLVAHGEWLAQPAGTVPMPQDLAMDLPRVGRVLDDTLARSPDGAWLARRDVLRLGLAAGLPGVATDEASSPEEAVAVAEQVGWPVVIKATGLDRYYRAPEGGVVLDLRTPDDVHQAWARLAELHPPEALAPALVQSAAAGGVDVHVAAHRHPDLGGVLSVGVGGIVAEGAAASRPVWVLPLSDAEAERLVASSPVAAPLAVADPDGSGAAGLAELLVRIAALVDAVPEITDLVANPVIVGPAGPVVTDLRVRVAPTVDDDVPAVRRLG